MFKVLCAVVGLTVGAAAAAWADEIRCGGDYVTQPGDTVYQVATRSFGPGLHRQLFVSALMQLNGGASDALPVGAVISVPCATENGLEIGGGFWSTAMPIEVAVATVGYDPAVAEAARGASGTESLLDALLGGALREGALSAVFERLPDDKAAAFSPFTKGAGELSFPWYASDCSQGAINAARVAALCSGALWSDPLFEVTSSIYVRANARQRSLHRHVRNGLCIADESRSAAIAARLLRDEAIRMAQRSDSAGCLSALQSGRVSAAIVPDFAVVVERRRNSGPGPQPVPGASFTDTVHAVVASDNPSAPRILKRLNDGLAEIRTSGAWYQIVRSELTKAYLN